MPQLTMRCEMSRAFTPLFARREIQIMRKIPIFHGMTLTGISLLFCLSLMPSYCAPPIRCLHQTTVIKGGKATTHLILTTAAINEKQTPQNTANIIYQGVIRDRPYSLLQQKVGEIVTNESGTVAVVHFDDYADQITSVHCPFYLFLSTEKGLTALPNFDVQVRMYLATTPVRHNDGICSPLHLWTPRQLYTMGITGHTLDIRIGAAEVTEGTVHLTVADNGHLTFAGYEEEGE